MFVIVIPHRAFLSRSNSNSKNWKDTFGRIRGNDQSPDVIFEDDGPLY